MRTRNGSKLRKLPPQIKSIVIVYTRTHLTEAGLKIVIHLSAFAEMHSHWKLPCWHLFHTFIEQQSAKHQKEEVCQFQCVLEAMMQL